MPFHKSFLLVPASAALAALAIAMVIVQPGVAQSVIPVPSAAAPGDNQISVVGSGTVLAQPDVARVVIGADVTNQSLAAAIADASTRMTAVIQKLKAAGVADQDIQTVNFSVYPQYDLQNNQQILRGYEVQNLVQARITNISGLGGLIDDAVGAGATRVYSVGFESSDPGALKTQARDQAMQNAQAKAAQLARDAGVSLGKVVRVTESDASGVTPVAQDAGVAVPRAALAAAPSTPIQGGQLSVSTTVQLVYAIQ